MRKRLILFIVFLPVIAIAMAQVNMTEQTGRVKTPSRIINGQLVPGHGIIDAVVQLKNMNKVTVRDKDGNFSFPLSQKSYTLLGVTKNGYQLVDMEICHDYNYSSEPLWILMETPEQQLMFKLSKEKQLRRDMTRKLEQREDEIEQLNISLKEKSELLQQVNKERNENEKIIDDLVKYYLTLDYDKLDAFSRQLNVFIEAGELKKADSLLNTRGSFTARKAEIEREEAAEAKRQEEIDRKQKENDQSRLVTKLKKEKLAEDSYSKSNICLQRHQNDSAKYYIEFRAALDTTNVVWQIEAGKYIRDYALDIFHGNELAMNYYQRALRHALIQEEGKGRNVAQCYNDIGNIYSSEGQDSIALQYHQKSLQIRIEVLGADHPDVAKSYNNIGNYYQGKDNEKSFEYHERAASITRAKLGERHPNLAMSFINMGGVRLTQKKYDEAEAYYKKALELYLEAYGENSKDVMLTYQLLGRFYSETDHYDLALESYKKGFDISANVFGERHPIRAVYAGRIANLLLKLNNPEPAIGYLQEKLATQIELFGEYHQDVAQNYNDIGYAYSELGKYELASEYLMKALSIREKLCEGRKPGADIAGSYVNIGLLFQRERKYEDALKYYEQALVIAKDSLPKKHFLTATIYNNMGATYHSLNKLQQAKSFYVKGLDMRIEILDERNPELALSYHNLGICCSDLGEFDIAVDYLKKGLELREKIFKSNDVNIIGSLFNLAKNYERMKDYQKALEYYDKQLSLEKTSQAESDNIIYDYINIGRMNHLLQRYQSAIGNYEKGLSVSKKLHGEEAPLSLEILAFMAEAYLNAGNSSGLEEKWDKAIPDYKSSLDIYQYLALKKNETYQGSVAWLQFILGVSYLRNSQSEDAYMAFKQAYPFFHQVYQNTPEQAAEYLPTILLSLSFSEIIHKDYALAEQYAREGLAVDSTQNDICTNLAPALLFQGKTTEAEQIYLQYKSELKDAFLDDFRQFEEAGAIPEERKKDVERIKKMLNE